METYYLSSLDSQLFGPARKCTIRHYFEFDGGRTGALVDLTPPPIGQNFNRANDISCFILIGRFKGEQISKIKRFPYFVYVVLPPEDAVVNPEAFDPHTFPIVAWAELYRTEDDARIHRFD